MSGLCPMPGWGALLARVLALLSHYRVDPHPPEVEQCEPMTGQRTWVPILPACCGRCRNTAVPRQCSMESAEATQG